MVRRVLFAALLCGSISGMTIESHNSKGLRNARGANGAWMHLKNASGNKTGNGSNSSNTTTETTTTTRMKEPEWNGNSWCIPETGRRCFNGPSDCEPWVACTENFYCQCHHWGCSDAQGVCRPVHNRWSDPMQAVRIAPSARPNWFMRMPADGKTNPSVEEEYPQDDDAEAHWMFLMLPDNETVLISTKMNAHQTNEYHTAYASYLDLPPPPWHHGSILTPIQGRPKNVLEAAWRLVHRPDGETGSRRIAMQHTWSERYLSFDPVNHVLSSCMEKDCAVGTIDFDLWPNLHDIPVAGTGKSFVSKASGKGVKDVEPWTPYHFDDFAPKKEPAGPSKIYESTNKTFKERDQNATKAALRGL